LKIFQVTFIARAFVREFFNVTHDDITPDDHNTLDVILISINSIYCVAVTDRRLVDDDNVFMCEQSEMNELSELEGVKIAFNGKCKMCFRKILF
jgi:uncharacterized membrane protein